MTEYIQSRVTQKFSSSSLSVVAWFKHKLHEQVLWSSDVNLFTICTDVQIPDYASGLNDKLSHKLQEAVEKMLDLFATASRFTLSFIRGRYCRHCRTPPAHRCPRRRQRQRVTEGTAMAPWNGPNKVYAGRWRCVRACCRITAKLSCQMTLQKLPFDRQTCSILFESCKYTSISRASCVVIISITVSNFLFI